MTILKDDILKLIIDIEDGSFEPGGIKGGLKTLFKPPYLLRSLIEKIRLLIDSTDYK